MSDALPVEAPAAETAGAVAPETENPADGGLNVHVAGGAVTSADTTLDATVSGGKVQVTDTAAETSVATAASDLNTLVGAATAPGAATSIISSNTLPAAGAYESAPTT